MKEELNFLKENISASSSVVIAVSGGPDSMCLLSLLLSLQKSKNLKIIVAHVNHKIRVESEKEAKMVEDYCHENGCIYELYTIDEYQNTKFSEEDARRKRYAFFQKLLTKYSSPYLLTAHHGDDLVETVLMRLSRGSNIKGFASIKRITVNDTYKTLRPLLTTTKENILHYLEENNIPYALDASNNDLKYTRNRYRHQVLPFLKKENKNVHKKYLKFSQELEAYENFVRQYIEKKQYISENEIDVSKIKEESDFIKRKCLELLIENIQKKDILDINDKQLKELMKLYQKNNITIDIKSGYKGINDYGKIKIAKLSKESIKEQIFTHDIKVNSYNFYYNPKKEGICIYLDSSSIALPLKIRSIQTGDRIEVKNLGGSKKVSDIFIDAKIPKSRRTSIPLLVDSENKVLWIPNIKKSQFCKDKSEKYDIIIKCEAR